MQPGCSRKKMIEKFDSLKDEDELDISWSSSESENSACSSYARGSARKPVKICRKRNLKSKLRGQRPSTKLRIRKQENIDKYLSDANINDEIVPGNELIVDLQPKSPILHCSSAPVNSNYKILKSNISISNKSKEITINDDSNVVVKRKISVPLYKSFSRNSDESYFSPNKEVLSSPILSQHKDTKGNCDNTISQVPISPLLSLIKKSRQDMPTCINNVNISPLLTNKILINEQHLSVKRKLTFDLPPKTNSVSYNQNEETSSPILSWQFVDNNQKSKVSQSAILSTPNIITSQQEDIVFKNFSCKSEPCSQISIDNGTPEIVDEVLPLQSQISIKSFTPTDENLKNSHSEKIVMVSSQSTVEVQIEQNSSRLHGVPTTEYAISGPSSTVKLRKKRLKRDGLAYRLQNALRSRKSAASIWKHEMFLAENTNFNVPIGDLPLCLKVLGGKRENGILALICERIDDNAKYVMIINEFLMKNAVFKDGQYISLYKPYELHVMAIDGTSVNVILNASKINY